MNGADHELIRRERDFARYRRHLMITDYAEGKLVPLQPNLAQWRIRAEIVAAEQARDPVRIIVLKARRLGVSTIVQATLAHRAFTRRDFRAITIAHETDNASQLHAMTEQMWENLPPPLRPPRQTFARGKLLSLENGSRLRVDTAKDKQAGRGMDARWVHASEVAFWSDTAKTLTAINSTVADQPGTGIVYESTPNGVGDLFHTLWERSVAGIMGFTPLFFSCFDFDEYSRPAPEGFREVLTEEEEAYLDRGYYSWLTLDRQPVTLDQLFWRRMVLENQCFGDPDMLHQEYPASPDEAFLSSSSPFFRHVTNLVDREALYQGDLVGELRKDQTVTMRFDDHKTAPLRVYEVRQPNVRYVCFMDVAGGITPREEEGFRHTDKRDAEDFTVGTVINCHTGRIAAVYRTKMDVDLATHQCAKLGAIYNKALIAPEMNGGFGITPVHILRGLGYPLYRRRKEDSWDRSKQSEYGWNTTELTRPLMLDGLQVAIREHPELLGSPNLHHEIKHFVKGRNGRGEADRGYHDDEVMSTAGSLALFREYAQASITLPGPRVSQTRPSVLKRALA